MYAGETKKLNDASTFIICPFHNEKTPSFRIFHGTNTRSPFGVCYGCGKKAAWDDLAPVIGLKSFEKQKPKDEFLNLSLLPSGDSDFGTEEMKEKIRFKALPKNKKWRGISTNLLIDIGAKKCEVHHPEHGWLKPKIYLPVMVRGHERGYIKARLKKHADFPSYINSSGVWSKTHGLFPYDTTVKLMRSLKSKTVVLVEGPRDALRLLSMGIPAMCILGTQSWTAQKTKVLELSGCTVVVLLMDGDCAGREATKKLKKELSSMFDLKVLKLWSIKGSPYIQFKDEEYPSKAAKAAGVSLWDPGNMPDWIANKIIDKYF
jgi:5S rRNA maturation endonuclease (ribonuclease M5)